MNTILRGEIVNDEKIERLKQEEKELSKSVSVAQQTLSSIQQEIKKLEKLAGENNDR